MDFKFPINETLDEFAKVLLLSLFLEIERFLIICVDSGFAVQVSELIIKETRFKV